MLLFKRAPRKPRARREARAVAGQGVPHHTGPLATIIDGRRYYGNAPYALPKDLQDNGRLNFQHYLLRCVMRGNYLATLEEASTRTILDVGCGTGRWCIEMAQAFPSAQVIGVDLELGGPEGMKTPVNYQFQQGNVLTGLPFADATFDYVHQRLLIMGIPLHQWVSELQELLRVTRPGGVLELVESGTTFFPAGELTQRWCDWGGQICASRGLDPGAAPRVLTFARQAGLQQLHSTTFDVPVGNWGGTLHGWEGRLGQMVLLNLRALFQDGVPLLKTELRLDAERVQALLPRLEEEWARLHTRLRYFVVLGRKADGRQTPGRPTVQLSPRGTTMRES